MPTSHINSRSHNKQVSTCDSGFGRVNRRDRYYWIAYLMAIIEATQLQTILNTTTSVPHTP